MMFSSIQVLICSPQVFPPSTAMMYYGVQVLIRSPQAVPAIHCRVVRRHLVIHNLFPAILRRPRAIPCHRRAVSCRPRTVPRCSRAILRRASRYASVATAIF